MNTALKPPVSDKVLSLAAVIGLHVLAGSALLWIAKPMLLPMLPEVLQVDLVSAAPPAETPLEPPKPVPPAPQAKPLARKPEPAKPVQRTAPLIQADAPAAPTAPVVAPPAPKEAPVVASKDAVKETAVPPAPPAPPAAEPIQQARFDAAYLNNPRPAYPNASRSLGEEGKVILRVQVSEDGRPLQVLVDASSGFARLDRAAREAVANWRFVPAKRGSEAVVAWVKVPLVFSLNQ